MPTPWPRVAVRALLAVSLAWTVANAAYVYFVLGGERLFRLETAIYILIAVAAVGMAVIARAADEHEDLSAAGTAAFALAAAALWLALMLPLVHFPLLSDDYLFRTRYAALGSIVSTGQFFRPLFGVVFALLDRLGAQRSPVPFHAAALVLHASAAMLTARLAWRVTGRRVASLAAGGLFLLNPAQLEATLWVSGLQEQLWATALLAALVVYTREVRLTGETVLATGVLVAGALLSKETAVAAALLIPLADGIFYRWRRGPWLLRGYVVIAVALGLYLVARSRVVTLESTFLVVPSQFFLKQLVSLPFKTLAQPWNAEALRMPLWVAFLTALTCPVLLAAAVWRGRADWRLLVGPGLVVGSVLPVYSYFFVDANLMSSRYIYFAAAGWSIVVADLLTRTLPSRRAWGAVVTCALVFAAVLLNANLAPWRSVGTMIADIKVRADAGEPPPAIVASWQERLGPDLKLREGIPRSYRGVYVFENGWQEFLDGGH